MSRTTGSARARKSADPLEAIWEDLLSRQPERVKAAYASLALDEQQAVLAHLRRMVNENGWHTQQRISARVALSALEDQAR